MVMRIKASPAYGQSGFTLIELIMVIVILGILSAFALPKFADFSGDAEKSSAEGARGAVKSASAITHAQYLAAGNSPGTVVWYLDTQVLMIVLLMAISVMQQVLIPMIIHVRAQGLVWQMILM